MQVHEWLQCSLLNNSLQHALQAALLGERLGISAEGKFEHAPIFNLIISGSRSCSVSASHIEADSQIYKAQEEAKKGTVGHSTGASRE